MNRHQFINLSLGAGLPLLAPQFASAGPMSPKPYHHTPRAKRCIMIFHEGAPSHIDTFDPKPELDKLHMKSFERHGELKSAMESGKRYYVKSPFKFRQVGESGAWMCEHYKELAKHADDMMFYKGCQAESVNHPSACFHMNTGNRFIGDPAIGSWVTMGLGSDNQDLPGYVVLPEMNFPQGGAANWSNGYLPAYYQGTPMRAQGSPVLDLRPPRSSWSGASQRNLSLLKNINAFHKANYPDHDDLDARMQAYDLAYRMQQKIPEVVDFSNIDSSTQQMYGLDQEETKSFGRRCLLASRLVEKGVRFVQVYSSGWDSHDYLERSHRKRIEATDRPIAGLLEDLKRKGMLEDTLVFCVGEFGRSPDNGIRGGGERAGRDHNAKAMTIWMAGGGVKAGHSIGATDDIGDSAVEVVRPIRDFHKTVLHILGLDDNRLTFFHGGRNKQLSQIGAETIREILA